MPTLNDWIEIIDFHCGRMQYWSGLLADGLHNAGTFLRANDLDKAGQSLQACHNYTAYFGDSCATYESAYEYAIVDTFQWIDTNWPEVGDPYQLTMDGILSVMLSADPVQVDYFVGLVDAYKQSIWNKPFNKEFYAALARGFMEWP